MSFKFSLPAENSYSAAPQCLRPLSPVLPIALSPSATAVMATASQQALLCVWSQPPEEEPTLFINTISNETQWHSGCGGKSFSHTELSHDRPTSTTGSVIRLLQGRTSGLLNRPDARREETEESGLSVTSCHQLVTGLQREEGCAPRV